MASTSGERNNLTFDEIRGNLLMMLKVGEFAV